jgi:hypothetical protein
MTPIELLKPWRIIVSLIPCLYASLLILELDNSLLLALMAALAVVALLWFVNSLGYPILLCLPAFAGAFLLVACIFVLLQGLPNQGLLPATRSSFELWAMVVLGLGYIGWGVLSARRVMRPA